ncbi:MAG TPA: MarR family transcriptional regulator [Mycobacteriales bacterium]|jgi:DNA-binding MarR family transcriptional regulator|nr:MarR family transcriptional regulator [Mycobacteriales bacterium]
MPTRTADAALASHLRMSVMRLGRRLRQQRADDTLTPSQIAALATLDRCGARTLAELAAAEHVQPPSMHRICGALEELGLVTKTPHPTDRRQVQYAVTPEGARLLAEDRKRRDAWLVRRLDDLTPAEVAVLREAAPILERLAVS